MTHSMMTTMFRVPARPGARAARRAAARQERVARRAPRPCRLSLFGFGGPARTGAGRLSARSRSVAGGWVSAGRARRAGPALTRTHSTPHQLSHRHDPKTSRHSWIHALQAEHVPRAHATLMWSELSRIAHPRCSAASLGHQGQRGLGRQTARVDLSDRAHPRRPHRRAPRCWRRHSTAGDGQLDTCSRE